MLREAIDLPEHRDRIDLRFLRAYSPACEVG
jgi:hypothetical protein